MSGDLQPTSNGTSHDTAVWRPLDAMPPEDVYIRAQALQVLAAAKLATDRPIVQQMLDELIHSDPIYVELRREYVKHQKLPADALPRWEP